MAHAGGRVRLRARRPAVGAAAHRAHERAGTLRRRVVALADRRTALALTEADINELAQAKGANAAGLRVLVECYGVPLSQDLARSTWPAASLVTSTSTPRAGSASCPTCRRERIVQVGNAALLGRLDRAAVALARAELEAR